MDNETWLTPQQALSKGFIDEITKVSASNSAPLVLEDITNVFNPDNPKTSKMKNVTTYLQLSEDATEDSILNAIKVIATARDTATTDLEARDGELKTATDLVDKQKLTIKSFEDNATELNNKVVEDAVEAAIKDGKLDKEKKDEIIEKFENNAPGLELLIGSLKSGAVRITDKLENSSSADTNIPADRKDWNIRKWEKEDQAGLDEILKNDLDLYKSMYKSHYKVDFAG